MDKKYNNIFIFLYIIYNTVNIDCTNIVYTRYTKV